MKLVVVDNSNRGLWGQIQDVFSALKMAAYLGFHTTQLERSFEVEEFLDEARHAYRVVNSLYEKGDFEEMERMVSPAVLMGYKKAYPTLPKDGATPAFSMEIIERANLVDVEYSVEKPGYGKYCLESIAQRLDGYHEDIFLVFSVRMLCTWVYRAPLGGVGAAADEHSANKAWQTVKFARQVPKIQGWNQPVDEIESPWYVVNLK